MTRFPDEGSDDVLSTLLVRCCMLPALVKGLACTLCGSCSLTVRVAHTGLGMVSSMKTYCTACEEVLNKTYSSDRIGGSKASNEPFVVTRSVVTATMDMGVGYGGLRKLCRYLDTPHVTPVMHHKTYITHAKEITNHHCQRGGRQQCVVLFGQDREKSVQQL